ncbi:gem-associated protein 8-like isoform X2 [Crassostrea virginica]
MEESDSSMTNGDQSAMTDSMKMESRILSVESEDILSSELTSSDSEARTSELNNTLTSLTPDPDLSNTDGDYIAKVRPSEYSSCSSCLDSSSCFTDESLDEASPQKRSKKLSGFSSQTWHLNRCFDRYWKHYFHSMSWCHRHFYLMRCMSDYTHSRGQHQLRRRGLGRSSGTARRGTCSLKRGVRGQRGQGRVREKTKAQSDVGAESDDSEVYEMELTDEMVRFFAHSEEHRKQRDASKEIIGKDGRVQKRIEIEEVKANKKPPTVSAPTERPGVRRTAEMTKLYGKGAAMIHGMETAIQMSYDRTADIQQPKYWPNMPLKIVFS